MCLTETRSAVDKEGVVRSSGVVCDRARRGVHELVILAHDEVFEREFRVEAGRGGIGRFVGRVVGVVVAALDFETEVCQSDVGFDDSLAHFLGERARNVPGKAFGRGFKHDISSVHVDGHKLFDIRRIVDMRNKLLHFLFNGII